MTISAISTHLVNQLGKEPMKLKGEMKHAYIEICTKNKRDPFDSKVFY